MKHLKEYEKAKNLEYNVGDIIVANNNKFVGPLNHYLARTPVKIFSITTEYQYAVKYDKNDIEIRSYIPVFYFDDYEIRYASKKEIEEYEIKKNIDKYNI